VVSETETQAQRGRDHRDSTQKVTLWGSHQENDSWLQREVREEGGNSAAPKGWKRGAGRVKKGGEFREKDVAVSEKNYDMGMNDTR